MNKDQVNGTLKDLAGKVQEQAGKLVGDKGQQAKGLLKQVEGNAEKKLGDAKESSRTLIPSKRGIRLESDPDHWRIQ